MSKGQKVILTPQSYPTVKWDGEILGSRKGKYGVTFKIKYDCGGMMLTGSFSAKEFVAV